MYFFLIRMFTIVNLFNFLNKSFITYQKKIKECMQVLIHSSIQILGVVDLVSANLYLIAVEFL